jgi:hypothetical protein
MWNKKKQMKSLLFLFFLRKCHYNDLVYVAKSTIASTISVYVV